MFYGCTSLTTAPVLPATTLAESCYQEMFQNCTRLATAPALPATTLAEHCYDSMFSYCSSLTTAPELSATTLVSYCYYNMFNSCTSLATAPELPATTLANYCYQYMFEGCTNLSTITCYAMDISAQGCTENWVASVASSGDFSGYSSANWQCGDSGIPNNWMVTDKDGGVWSNPCAGPGYGGVDPPDAPDPD